MKKATYLCALKTNIGIPEISQMAKCTIFGQFNLAIIICQPQGLSFSHFRPLFQLKIYILGITGHKNCIIFDILTYIEVIKDSFVPTVPLFKRW